MNHPLQITFRHMDASPAVEARIRDEVEALHQFFSRITSCRVVVEKPHRQHQQGSGFHVSIDLHVPGSVIVVNHHPSLHGPQAGGGAGHPEKHTDANADHAEIYLLIRDAFAAARRRLEDYARVLRGDTKHHAKAETRG